VSQNALKLKIRADPSPLFYDPTGPTGDERYESADDVEKFEFPGRAIYGFSEISSMIEYDELMGNHVTEAFIFGHGLLRDEDDRVIGIRIAGTNYIDPTVQELQPGEGDLRKACEEIKNNPRIPKGLKLNFRQCDIADADGKSDNGTTDLSLLQKLAEWTGHTVTAVAGTVTHTGQEQPGPDYVMEGDLWEVTPGGKPKKVWDYLTAEERKTKRQKPQPY